MKNIVIGMFKHETNSANPRKTDRDAYRKRNYFKGDEIPGFFRGTGTEIGGFLSVLESESDVRIVPSVAFDAMPGGIVTADMATEAADGIIRAARACGRADGILLCLHGAMITESTDDGEGALLSALRRELGKDIPIVATLDLHANVTPLMLEHADALFPYHHYPHTDHFDRGEEAARCILSCIDGKKPFMAAKKLPLILPCLPTTSGPMAEFERRCRELEKEPDITAVNVCHGFLSADTSGAGVCVIALSEDAQTAKRCAEDLGNAIWEARAALKRDYWTAEDAIADASGKKGPFCFADVCDNPGGGGSCDSTWLLRALVESGVKNAAFAEICDPESVELAFTAGVGAERIFRLGGKYLPEINGEPVVCSARVLRLGDGVFTCSGRMQHGLRYNLGRTAVLKVGDIEVIVSENRVQPFDLEVFRSNGIAPEEKDILAIKSTIHFRANYEGFAKKIYEISLPGLTPQDPASLGLKRCPRPIYPLDNI